MVPKPIQQFVDAFAKLPSIGPRQATRLAFFIKNLGAEAARELSESVAGLAGIKTCAHCFASYTAHEDRVLCGICSNPSREHGVIAVVEKETDLISLEKTKKFGGVYFVLGDLKKEGILDATHTLRLSSLKGRIAQDRGRVKEIILAINPTTYGDINASLIARELKNSAEKVSRLGRGIPTGGEIEFADEDTLGGALENRK